MKGIKVVFDFAAFAELSAGSIARYLREHKNTAIVGSTCGIDRHVVAFESWSTLRKYEESNL